MTPFALTLKSVRNRRFTVGLTVASIALSVALLVGVERIRREARTSFTNTVSGTDLIVGARTSPVQLLLASVFRLSDTYNTMAWSSYEMLAARPEVAWTIPVSLGDSHRGYRVLGTTPAYFDHFRYGRKQALQLAQGTWFDDMHDCVLGVEAARALGYGLGDKIVIAHGQGDISFIEHSEHPFAVSGILQPTGTPVDQTLHVSLDGLDRIHADMMHGGDDHEHHHDPLMEKLEKLNQSDEHRKITAVFVGLHQRAASLSLQRLVNEYQPEALTAALPALTLQELWEMVDVVERTLLAISVFVVLVGLCGMLTSLLTSLNERRREMAILRSMGARPAHVLALIVGEAAVVTLSGIICGVALLYGLVAFFRPLLLDKFGLAVELGFPGLPEWGLLAAVAVAGILVGLIPGYRCYRYALSDGLTLRT